MGQGLLAGWTAHAQEITAVAETALKSPTFLQILSVAGLSMVPTFESRYAISVGVHAFGMPLGLAFPLALLASIVPIPIILWFVKPVLQWMMNCPIRLFNRISRFMHERVAKKVAGHEKMSLTALFLFVAVPVPGTGVWTGSLIAGLLEIKKKPALTAIILGDLVACIITTLIDLGITAIF